MTAEITLYDYWRSSASYRVRIALGLKGLSYTSQSIDLLDGSSRSPEHLARNPQGLVPALAIDGLMLTQSLAMLTYLDETRPNPPLLPVPPAARAHVHALAHAIAMEIHPICNLRVINHAVRDAKDSQQAKIAWMRQFITPGLEAFEVMLVNSGAFCFGDQPGYADCCLIPQLYNARRWGADFSHLPKICAIEARCCTIMAFQNAHPDAVKP